MGEQTPGWEETEQHGGAGSVRGAADMFQVRVRVCVSHSFSTRAF